MRARPNWRATFSRIFPFLEWLPELRQWAVLRAT